MRSWCAKSQCRMYQSILQYDCWIVVVRMCSTHSLHACVHPSLESTNIWAMYCTVQFPQWSHFIYFAQTARLRVWWSSLHLAISSVVHCEITAGHAKAYCQGLSLHRTGKIGCMSMHEISTAYWVVKHTTRWQSLWITAIRVENWLKALSNYERSKMWIQKFHFAYWVRVNNVRFPTFQTWYFSCMTAETDCMSQNWYFANFPCPDQSLFTPSQSLLSWCACYLYICAAASISRPVSHTRSTCTAGPPSAASWEPEGLSTVHHQ